MKHIRWRLFWTGALVAACIFFLIPRDVDQRAYDPVTGQMQTTTVRRVPIGLGLDLRGGVHLALEVDESRGAAADCEDAIQRAAHIVRTRLNEFGTSDRVVQVVGGCRLIVELPGITDPERARTIVMRTAFLEFRITDSEQRFRNAIPSMDAALRRAGVESAGSVTARDEPASALFGADTTLREPREGWQTSRTGSLSARLLPGQLPGEFLVPEAEVDVVESLIARPLVQRLVPRGLELKWGTQMLTLGAARYRPLYAVDARAIITGEELERAVAGRDPMTNSSEVQFELSRAGGRRFAEATGQNIGNHLAILLDGRVEGRPPVIQNRIASSGRIQLGDRSFEEANDLALTLRAGALPAPLHVVEERTIGPSLGHDSIRDGVRASALAVGLVLLMMCAWYRFLGLIAICGLFLYLLFTLGGLAAFGFALTLPGLAGFALSIGMAVDANVLIFERIREELRSGSPIRTAVDRGFRHALSAIVDSNVTTALTALILFLVGTSPVKGFAITLLVGLAASMVAAIFVTRTFFMIWLNRRRVANTVSGLAARVFEHAKFDFIRMRRRALAVSVLFILPGLLLLAVRGATYSIEFTGGTMLHIRTAQPVGTGALRSALELGALGGVEIQSFGSDRDYVIRTRLDAEQTNGPTDDVAAAVRTALDAGLGAGGFEVVQAEAIGPKVGGELQRKAVIAILFSFVTTLIYLAFRFHWKFGLAAVLATAHDILAGIAFIRYLDIEVSLVVVAAVLTVLGYSLNDTIIIFDRVRENLTKHRQTALSAVLNLSINETLPRTLLTGGTTMATALVLAFLAGAVIRPFALVMCFGIVIGTFSSIFVAAPIVLWIDRWWRHAGVTSGPVGTRGGRERVRGAGSSPRPNDGGHRQAAAPPTRRSGPIWSG